MKINKSLFKILNSAEVMQNFPKSKSAVYSQRLVLIMNSLFDNPKQDTRAWNKFLQNKWSAVRDYLVSVGALQAQETDRTYCRHKYSIPRKYKNGKQWKNPVEVEVSDSQKKIFENCTLRSTQTAVKEKIQKQSRFYKQKGMMPCLDVFKKLYVNWAIVKEICQKAGYDSSLSLEENLSVCTDKEQTEEFKKIAAEIEKLRKIDNKTAYPNCKYERLYTPFHSLKKQFRRAIEFANGERLIEVADATSAFFALSALAYYIDENTPKAEEECKRILQDIDNDTYSQIAEEIGTDRPNVKRIITSTIFRNRENTEKTLQTIENIRRIINRYRQDKHTGYSHPLQYTYSGVESMCTQKEKFKTAFYEAVNQRFDNRFDILNSLLLTDNIGDINISELQEKIRIISCVLGYMKHFSGYWNWLQRYPEKVESKKSSKSKRIRLLSEFLQISEGHGMFGAILPAVSEKCGADILSLHDSLWMRESIVPETITNESFNQAYRLAAGVNYLLSQVEYQLKTLCDDSFSVIDFYMFYIFYACREAIRQELKEICKEVLFSNGLKADHKIVA